MPDPGELRIKQRTPLDDDLTREPLSTEAKRFVMTIRSADKPKTKGGQYK